MSSKLSVTFDLLDLMLVDPRTPDGAVEPALLERADRELVDDTFRAMSLQFVAQDGAATASEMIANIAMMMMAVYSSETPRRHRMFALTIWLTLLAKTKVSRP